MNESEFLAAYDMSRYERPSVTADIAAFMMRSEQEDNYRKDADAHLSLLLIRRGAHDPPAVKDGNALMVCFLNGDCFIRNRQ